MELDELRDRIRECDEKIVALISQRTEIARRIAKVKIENDMPIKNPEAEERVKNRYRELGKKNGLNTETMDAVSSALINEAIDAENRVKEQKKE